MRGGGGGGNYSNGGVGAIEIEHLRGYKSWREKETGRQTERQRQTNSDREGKNENVRELGGEKTIQSEEREERPKLNINEETREANNETRDDR